MSTLDILFNDDVVSRPYDVITIELTAAKRILRQCEFDRIDSERLLADAERSYWNDGRSDDDGDFAAATRSYTERRDHCELIERAARACVDALKKEQSTAWVFPPVDLEDIPF